MTEAADLVLTNAEVHPLATPDGRGADAPAEERTRERTGGHADEPTAGDAEETFEAVAVRDGRIVRVGDAYEVAFLEGVDTRVVDLGGRVVLPGFVDAHTHLPMVGRALVHTDLSGASSPNECTERLRERAAELDGERSGDGDADEGGEGESEGEGDGDAWVLGFGYDESDWTESRYLDRGDLDRVSETVPVAAFREDLHVGSLNSVALDRLLDEMPDRDVRRRGGTPTGVVVETALDVVYRAIEPGPSEMRELLSAAQSHAAERGVTGVHDMVRRSRAPEVYREMAADGDLTLRVRLNYWANHLDALREAGLRTNHGDGMVRVGAIKTYTDGSIGARTAKLSEPYEDTRERDSSTGESDSRDGEGGERGEWVVPPTELESLVERAHGAGFQVAAHAIGDEAINAALDAYAALPDGDGGAVERRRHRIEHAELASDEAVERMADLGVVASMQPNFHKWAREGGLYDARLGDRRTATNRLGDFAEAGVRLAFGSDCMPLDPLFGVDEAVNAPAESQRLDVTAALLTYTAGGAYAGFDEGRLGSIEVGKRADLVALSRSPWERPDDIADIDVCLTVVDGEVVYDAR